MNHKTIRKKLKRNVKILKVFFFIFLIIAVFLLGQYHRQEEFCEMCPFKVVYEESKEYYEYSKDGIFYRGDCKKVDEMLNETKNIKENR